MAQLDWDGNKGVENLMGIYVQHTLQNIIATFRLVHQLLLYLQQ
jgi:hypothetical protein